ncbi:helix-turn-helix domain-containing protein [Sphingomonas donggukensis]|uniref:Helix-turn-helix domain-containing protein n=1 Tax=Sphingomonas donggukensis TaxID=2949093 RepID=A0ABY4TU91_9SPHN|nr:helix-turn-helix transcriptional regulator [Sphingomonas donggukensis]URW75903.1 helix-turn-helix domain-containing protein [Sphingomonas donggukensis]
MTGLSIDWRATVDEAIRRRKAEGLSQRALASLAGVSVPTVNAFEQGDIRLRFERIVAILGALGLFAQADASDALSGFIRVSRGRWDSLVAGLPPEHPARALRGSFEFVFELPGITPSPAKALRDWLEAEPRHTVWQPFAAGGGKLRVVEGALEYWAGDASDVTIGDFWRLDPAGRGFVRQGYREDAPGSLSPGLVFDLSLPIHQLTSLLRQAASLARFAGADRDAVVRLRGAWRGLAGRTLHAWADPRLRGAVPADALALSDSAEIDVELTLGALEGDLPSAVATALAPLFERFQGFALPRELVAGQIGETARREGVSIGPFEVPKALVAGLGDEQLRTLLGKLLEAEASARGIALSGIDLGGNQTAADGGVDALLRWRDGPEPGGWLPARDIVFQCKAQVLRPAQVADEMRPKGVLRPIFTELANDRGAYVLFTTDDVGTKGQTERLARMKDALADLPGGERVTLDFIGPDRIARWVNQHPGVALWLLQSAGRPLRGWRPYGAWSAEASAGAPYLLDESVRATVAGDEGDIRSAIGAIRGALATGGSCVRLVGISGMGKTRLAEALFDPRVPGGPALSPSLAVYADAGLELATGAPLVAEQLVLAATQAVLIVDNCTARAHAQLSEIVRRGESRVSLLTIDYDVGEEEPSDSLVVRLGANSEDLLRALLKQRVPSLREAEIEHLARFSEGNARVALAIARGADKGIDLSKISDTELLDRLFQAERGGDPEARRAADAAALVYAFHADPSDVPVEHPVLAAVAGMPPQTFYRHVETMLSWGIAQQRGVQRAVKPDLIADQLAAATLAVSDADHLLVTFASGPERLFASFARRLGRLDRVPRAQAIAARLLAPGQWLDDPRTWRDEQRRAFFGLAPAAPLAALELIERTLAGDDRSALTASHRDRDDFAELLVHLAYDETLFPRAMRSLVPLVLGETNGAEQRNLRDYFLQRFWPALSWTHARTRARLDVVDQLLDEGDSEQRSLALEALDHMLDAWHITSSFDPSFGSQPRQDEWRPRGEDYRHWYEEASARIERIASSDDPLAERARQIVAEQLRAHVSAGMGDLAVASMRRVRPTGYWDAGWRQVSETLHFGEGVNDEGLRSLERELRPHGINELFDAFVLGEPWRHWHPRARENHYTRNVQRLARRVGVSLVRSGVPLDDYLARALSITSESSVMAFGEGLAHAVPDLRALWDRAYRLYVELPAKTRDPGLLIGIVRAGGKRDRPWSDGVLDAAAIDPELRPQIVYFHSARPLDARDVERFIGALDGGASPEHLGALMFGGATDTISGEDLARLLRRLMAHPEGALPALQILHMRIYGDKQKKRELAPELTEVARLLLHDKRVYRQSRRRGDRELAVLAKLVFKTEQGAATAVAIARALRELRGSDWMDEDFTELGRTLLAEHPRVVLDEILADIDKRRGRRGLVDALFGGILGDRDNQPEQGRPVLDAEVVRNWVAEEPQPRSVQLASLIPYTSQAADGILGWSDLARLLIDLAPDPVPVLRTFEDRFFNGVSTGSFSSRFVRRLPMVGALKTHFDRRVRSWAREAEERLQQSIIYWDERDREGDSRFE